MRYLKQHPGAIAGARIATGTTPVRQIPEQLQGVANELMRCAPMRLGDEADAAGVVLERWIVQSLFRRDVVRIASVVEHRAPCVKRW